MLGIRYVKDAGRKEGINFIPAVYKNGPELARALQLQAPSAVPIKKIILKTLDQGVVFSEEIGEGKYLSAVWYYAVMKEFEEFEGCNYCVSSLAIRLDLAEYLGEKITQEARDLDRDDHTFARVIFTHDQLYIIVEY